MRSPLAGSLLLSLIACGGNGETPAGPPPSSTYQQQMHLASLANGAVVIARSGELGLDNSAVMSLDGSLYTTWHSPPEIPDQWMIVRLPASSRVDGIRIANHEENPTSKQVLVEGSSDGAVWRELATIDVENDVFESSADVSPAEVALLRVSMLGSEKQLSGLSELVVEGEQIGHRKPVEWGGAWKLNQREAQFAMHGSMVHGSVPFLRRPMRIIGKPRNGFLPFAWSMGYATGYGMVSASAQGEMSGYWAWDEHYDWQIAESWFGQRTSSAAEVTLDRREFALDFLRRRRGAPFFELVSPDGSPATGQEAREALDVIRGIVSANPEVRFRLTSFDVEGVPSAEALVRSVAQELGSGSGELPNLEFAVTAGNMLEQPPRHAQSRALYQRMDLEIGSAAAGNTPPIVLR